MWDAYIDNEEHTWKHARIRAEANGVSLNAHVAGGDDGLNIDGILDLATTMRRAVEHELTTNYHTPLPEPSHFDNIIIRTLIQHYGTYSYGFTLRQGATWLFNEHSYFGFREASRSPDSFPHILVKFKHCRVLDQLRFLLDHVRGM